MGASGTDGIAEDQIREVRNGYTGIRDWKVWER